MFGLGPAELLIILVILVVIFGANRLGEIGGALGKTVREFRKELKTEEPAKPEAAKAEEAKPGVTASAATTSEENKS
jgi:sec-independent protein translocase protein TatA